MNDADPIIRLHRITKFFGAFKALNEVSLDIRAGQKVVVHHIESGMPSYPASVSAASFP